MKQIRHDAYGCLPMAALVIGLCGLAWWLASPASAENSGTCASIERVESDVAAWQPPTAVTRMNKAETAAFLAKYNAEPPSSFLSGESAVAIDRPNSILIVFVVFEAGCAKMTLYIRRTFFEQLMGIES